MEKHASTRQVAAVPLRQRADGNVEVLLVTSRETGRWVIPKGWPSRRLADNLAAAREAKEEAGVTGPIGAEPIGTYRYLKRERRRARMIDVAVFRMDVKKEMKNWPERGQRTRTWFSISDARRRVREPRLKQLLATLEP